MPRKPVPNLYKRGPVFWGCLIIAGRKHRRSLRTTDPKEARHRLAAWRTKLERSAVGVADCPTVKEATLRWATEVLPKAVKPAVAKRYLCSIAQVVDGIGDLPVDQITGATITAYASRRSTGASNATIRRDITALSRLLASCVAWGLCETNVARFYDRSLLRERREPIRPPDRADIEKVISAPPPAMAAVLRLLDQTGMREAEAVMLTGTDIDATSRQIRLTKTKTSRPRTIEWQTPGGDAGIVLEGLDGTGPLFSSGAGEPYRNFPTHAAKVIANVAKREGSGFRRFRVHDLRHGFAIRALRNGMDIYSLSKHLGHSSLKTTEGYLAYLTVTEQTGVKISQNRTQQG